MNLKTLIIEYFTDPFSFLGLSLFVIELASGYNAIIDNFRTFLFVKYFFWCFFFPALYLSIKLTTEPIKPIKQYRKMNKLGTPLMIAATVVLNIWMHTIPLQFEPFEFFSDKFHVIAKPEVAMELFLVTTIGGSIVAPGTFMYSKWAIRKQLEKDNIKTDTQIDYGVIF